MKIKQTLQKIVNSPVFILLSVGITFIIGLYLAVRVPSTKFSENNHLVTLNKENTSPSSSLKPTTLPTNPPTTIKKQTLPVLNGGNIFNLVNAYRSANGKPFLSVSSELCGLAEERADYMIVNHREAFKTSTVGNHSNFSEATLGYSGGMIGENLAMNVTADQKVISLWKSSPPHNSLMLMTEKDGFVMSKACVATRVVKDGSIIVLLIGDK